MHDALAFHYHITLIILANSEKRRTNLKSRTKKLRTIVKSLIFYPFVSVQLKSRLNMSFWYEWYVLTLSQKMWKIKLARKKLHSYATYAKNCDFNKCRLQFYLTILAIFLQFSHKNAEIEKICIFLWFFTFFCIKITKMLFLLLFFTIFR